MPGLREAISPPAVLVVQNTLSFKHIPLKIGVRCIQSSHHHTLWCCGRFAMSQLTAAKASRAPLGVTDGSRSD